MTTKRPVFTPHYRISVQRNDDCLLDVPGHEEPVRIDAPTRTPEGDIAAVKRAIEIANTLTVGADGRVEFKGYTVYVNHCESFGEQDLLACVDRQYSWDSDSDWTFAAPHAGRMSYDDIDPLNPADTTNAPDAPC